MLLVTGLMLLFLGVFVWLFGNRMWLLGAAAGALLAFGILSLFPSLAEGWLGFIIVAVCAVGLGVLGFIGKAFAKVIAMVIGFLAGGGLVIALFNIFNVNITLLAWILALVGGLIGAVVFNRFIDMALIIFASLMGSMLVVRGLMTSFLPSLSGTLGTVLVLVLTGLGIVYHARQKK